MFNVEITSRMCKLFEFLKSYKNCFDFKNAETFFEHENKNHIIDLILDVKSLYESLYIPFKIEFNVLKNYLLKNLILNGIREFTSRASALMFFIFKKNNNFQFYIDYKELNILIIKNKYLLLLIDETLNCFLSTIYFIKLDFKNAYRRIKLCKDDK